MRDPPQNCPANSLVAAAAMSATCQGASAIVAWSPPTIFGVTADGRFPSTSGPVTPGISVETGVGKAGTGFEVGDGVTSGSGLGVGLAVSTGVGVCDGVAFCVTVGVGSGAAATATSGTSNTAARDSPTIERLLVHIVLPERRVIACFPQETPVKKTSPRFIYSAFLHRGDSDLKSLCPAASSDSAHPGEVTSQTAVSLGR